MTLTQPVTLMICALGGEGGGVLTQWLVDTARVAGYAAQSTSIPGVAQRTGATTYFLEVFPVPLSQLNGRRPVFSLNPMPGAVDGLISSELLETARCASNGLPSPGRTLVITSSSRTLTTQERSNPGDGRLDDAALLALVQSVSRAHHVLDMPALARAHGTAVSAVMLGALAASGLFPFPKDAYVRTVRSGGRAQAASLAGFEAAYAQIMQAQVPQAITQQLLSELAQAAPENKSGAHAVLEQFPASLHPMVSLGYARVVEYQDADYGALYVSRLVALLEAEQLADPHHENSHALTRDAARWLALWMAYDDIVRVADLKSRASRSERVRAEVKPAQGDLLKVFEHFKPGVPELAAMLPPSWSRFLLGWNRKRIAAGKESWALPIKLGSHTVAGMLALRFLAAFKSLRRYGHRYQEEQTLIAHWLNTMHICLREDWQLGAEIAACGRLIKGYGATNERARDNLLHVINHLSHPSYGSAASRAAAIRRLREAALQDEAGTALDQALAALGAPPRPVKAQPIRWMPRTNSQGK
jgi:indolepyruvate ferredoxin oxidoreductase beta subunit